LALLPTWHRRGFIEASKTLVTTRRAYRERLHSKNRRGYVPTLHWPVFTHSGPSAAPRDSIERLRRNVPEEYYEKLQKAATLHDLRTPTRQSGRSAIRRYRRGLLGMHRSYRGGNGVRRVARLRTPRIRGRTSAWLDRSVQAMTRKLQ
jgi:hypothetical protein